VTFTDAGSMSGVFTTTSTSSVVLPVVSLSSTGDPQAIAASKNVPTNVMRRSLMVLSLGFSSGRPNCDLTSPKPPDLAQAIRAPTRMSAKTQRGAASSARLALYH
jgi:hypothetical protein